MSTPTKERKQADEGKPKEKSRTRIPREYCEICGQALEREPESGEYSCPDCDAPEA